MAAIDRVLYLGNATMHRWSSSTLAIPRIHGKIALEEHVGTGIWTKYNITSLANQIAGIGPLPFTGPNGIDTISRLTNVTSRLSSMDNAGISYVIVSIGAPGIQGIPNTTQAVQVAQEINDEIYSTYVKPRPSRFGFWASVAMQNATAAAIELERSVKHLGAKGAMIHGYTEVLNLETKEIEVQYLDDPRCMPFWSKVAELDVPIYLHPRSPPVSQQLMFNNANNTRSKYPGLVTAGWGFTAEAAVHSLRLMLSGLFDTYPNLQIILGHAAEGLPFLVHRIDTQLSADASHHNSAGVPTYDHPLRYYLRNNFHATLSGVRRLSTVRCTLDEMGEERVMFSVDYPFQSDQDASDWFDYVEGIGVEAKKKIAWGNAKKLLKITEVSEGWMDDEEFCEAARAARVSIILRQLHCRM